MDLTFSIASSTAAAAAAADENDDDDDVSLVTSDSRQTWLSTALLCTC